MRTPYLLEMKVRNGEDRRPALQRYRSVTAYTEFDPISTKQSLGVLVQFHVLLIAKSLSGHSRERIGFLTVAVNIAAIAGAHDSRL